MRAIRVYYKTEDCAGMNSPEPGHHSTGHWPLAHGVHQTLSDTGIIISGTLSYTATGKDSRCN